MNKVEIKELRIKLGLSQQTFATKLGIGITTINRWERGKFKPSHLAMEKLKTLAKELNNKD